MGRVVRDLIPAGLTTGPAAANLLGLDRPVETHDFERVIIGIETCETKLKGMVQLIYNLFKYFYEINDTHYLTKKTVTDLMISNL